MAAVSYFCYPDKMDPFFVILSFSLNAFMFAVDFTGVHFFTGEHSKNNKNK